MAIEMKPNNTVGCAYYLTIEETLCLQEDIPMAGIEIVETLLLQAQPTTVIINNRAPAKMADYLEAHAQDLDGSNASHGKPTAHHNAVNKLLTPGVFKTEE